MHFRSTLQSISFAFFIIKINHKRQWANYPYICPYSVGKAKKKCCSLIN